MGDWDIPKDKYDILATYHNSIVGHLGLERFVMKLKDAGHGWTYMRLHAKTFIHMCPCCQKMSQIKIPILTHPFFLSVLRPMEKLHIDFLSIGIKNENGEDIHLWL